MKKRILMGLFLMAVLSIHTAAASTAFPNVFSGEASPKYTICKSCGEQAVRQEPVRYGKWDYVGDVPCVHEGGEELYQDEREVRLKLSPYVCTNCGLGDSEVEIEEKFTHIGDKKRIQYIL